MKKLVIGSFYTKGYTYALKAQAHRLLSNLDKLGDDWSVYYIAVTDSTEEALAGFQATESVIGQHATMIQIAHDFPNAGKVEPYKQEAQLMLAQMIQAVITKAKQLDADQLWLVEADVLPAYNSLRCLQDVINFDNHYYDIAFGPYPSNGGGSFLGGYGSPTAQIYKDFLPNERLLTPEVKKEIEASEAEEKECRDKRTPLSKEWITRRSEIDKSIENCPPIGNIWEVNAKHGWRRRGWLDSAFPAISKGAVVEVDWCGTGCTLLSKKALDVSSLDGYPGQGTQDLFLIWNRWHPAGLRIGLTTQALSDHVIKTRDDKGVRTDKLVHLVTFYETQGEAKGHIRWRSMPWYSAELGEKLDPANDGVLRAKPLVE